MGVTLVYCKTCGVWVVTDKEYSMPKYRFAKKTDAQKRDEGFWSKPRYWDRKYIQDGK